MRSSKAAEHRAAVESQSLTRLLVLGEHVVVRVRGPTRRTGADVRGLGQRDSFTGEDEPPVTFDWIWPAAQASALDVLGQPQSDELQDGRVTAQVSLTPLFHHRRVIRVVLIATTTG